MQKLLIWCLKGIVFYIIGLICLLTYAVYGDVIADLVCPDATSNIAGSARCYAIFLSPK